MDNSYKRYKRKLDEILDGNHVIFEQEQNYCDDKLMQCDEPGLSDYMRCMKKSRLGLDSISDNNSWCHHKLTSNELSIGGSLHLSSNHVEKSKSMYLSQDLSDDEEIPSANEVIDSLRKVRLWLRAQEDNQMYSYVESVNQMEEYAKFKAGHLVAQKKITHYFNRM